MDASFVWKVKPFVLNRLRTVCLICDFILLFPALELIPPIMLALGESKGIYVLTRMMYYSISDTGILGKNSEYACVTY